MPEVIGKLTAAGHEVLVQAGAGIGAAIPDADFGAAGARVVAEAAMYAEADVVLRVQKPTPEEIGKLHAGQVVIGLLQPLIDPQNAQALARAGVTAVCLDTLPRTLSRAQTMDALSSQANVGGYKAVIMAADAYGRYFPLLTTAAGTAKPANVLILGVGVAGLQAIATARRLGAVVKAYDVRAETKEQAESLGAQFLKLESVADATGSGRLRARAHRRRAQGPAGGAQQAHRRHGRRHHHGPGAGPSPAAARHRGRGARHEGGLGHRGHGRQRARRQRRAVRARTTPSSPRTA